MQHSQTNLHFFVHVLIIPYMDFQPDAFYGVRRSGNKTYRSLNKIPSSLAVRN